MLASVARRIYWMSRQMERAESMARILGVTSNLMLFGERELQRQNLRSEERRVGKECRYWRDWSSDVCSSDLSTRRRAAAPRTHGWSTDADAASPPCLLASPAASTG